MTQLVMFDYNVDVRDKATVPAHQPATLGVDPVGELEIGQRLGVRAQTVAQWHYRGQLPPPRWTVSGRPAWNWPDLERWARQTGKLDAPPAKNRSNTASRVRRRGGTKR
jgi:hypothetical protein